MAGVLSRRRRGRRRWCRFRRESSGDLSWLDGVDDRHALLGVSSRCDAAASVRA